MPDQMSKAVRASCTASATGPVHRLRRAWNSDAPHPMLSMHVFSNRPFTAVNLTSLLIRELAVVFGVAVLASIFARHGGYATPADVAAGVVPALWAPAALAARAGFLYVAIALLVLSAALVVSGFPASRSKPTSPVCDAAVQFHGIYRASGFQYCQDSGPGLSPRLGQVPPTSSTGWWWSPRCGWMRWWSPATHRSSSTLHPVQRQERSVMYLSASQVSLSLRRAVVFVRIRT